MPRKEAILWYKAAAEDLEDAQLFLNRRRWFRAAFFAQQAVEKALKALYIHKLRREPPRTHIISEIYSELKRNGVITLPPDDEIKVIALGKYYTVTRYPDAANGLPSESVSKEEAEIAVSIARKVLDIVGQTLGKDP